MQYIKSGEIYKIIRVTGPSHNLLGLVFSDKEINLDDIEIIKLTKKANEISQLIPENIKYQVLEGLDEINNELDKKYNIKQIYFIDSDTPSLDIYKELTKEIILKIHSGFNFNNE